ncbi:Transposase and inactivated derivatives, TnpA family [Rhizobiales bacterium GAS188]|nr:Transposase and inactivated derivatives, TnpA family [Rhizobiales bacterium GAS188]
MARRQLLTDDERRRVFGVPESEAEIIRHYTLSPADLDLTADRHGSRNRLGVAVQLCLLRHPGFGLRVGEEIPEALLAYLAHQLAVPPGAFRDYGRRAQTRLDHAGEIAAHLGLRTFARADLSVALDVAAAAAWSTDKGEPIARGIVEGLRAAKLILPAMDTIERVGLAGRARARRHAADALVATLTSQQLGRLDRLLVNDIKLNSSPLAWLRDIPESPSTTNINCIVERLAFVRAIGVPADIAGAVHEHRFRQFVREGAVAPAFLLSDYSAGRRRATLVASLVDLEARLSDAAVEMFDKLVGSLFTRAKRGQERRYQATARDVGQLMRLFGRTIAALSEAREGEADALAVIDEAVSWHRLLAAKPQVDALAELAGEDMLVSAAERYATIRRFAPAFLNAFTFRAPRSGTSLMQAVEILRELNLRNRREVPDGAPLPFQNKQWKRLVRENGRINRRLYETAVLSTLRDCLRAGDVWIEGTRNYRPFDAYLLPKREAAECAAGLAIVGDAGAYVTERAHVLDWRLKRFARLLRQDKLDGVSLVHGKLKVTPLPPHTPPEAEVLDRKLDTLLPRVRVTELLREVAARTGFLSAFRDLRSGKAHDNPNAVLAAVLADATNLGLERMANASQGVSYAQLAWTHNWYLSGENYRAALAAIIDAHHELPFARHWGDGSASSSDGQFFRAGRERAGAAEVNAKYGGEPGVKIYTHLSDHFASFQSRVISATASEAPYVLDGLLLHASSLAPRVHYTDTGGATDHVFALCHLLGYCFVPRLRDLADRRLGSVEPAAHYKGLETLIGRPIRSDAIVESWDDIIRLAASIKAGTVAPSTMLKKLGAYKRQNRLDFALGEVGRFERTLFTLDWLESSSQRRACQAGLNKGEARHALARAVYAHRQGRFADRTLENQEHRASGLNLVIAAIAYWNTLYLERAAEHLRGRGETVPHELLAHLSPMGWTHVGLTGDYLWERTDEVAPGSYRPLNDPGARLRSAA